MFDSSKLSFGGLCEKALTLSEALFSEEEELDGKLLACGIKNKINKMKPSKAML